jgi:hypothetical protein
MQHDVFRFLNSDLRRQKKKCRETQYQHAEEIGESHSPSCLVLFYYRVIPPKVGVAGSIPVAAPQAQPQLERVGEKGPEAVEQCSRHSERHVRQHAHDQLSVKGRLLLLLRGFFAKRVGSNQGSNDKEAGDRYR